MQTVGWREWVKLPELGIPGIKAKVDTGAKTSCLHAFEVRCEPSETGEVVHFKIHPLRKRREVVLECSAPLVDRRIVKDSGGHAEERLVIRTRMIVGPVDMDAEFTLTSRDDMIFPMLMGRRVIKAAGLVVDVNQSYRHGRLGTRNYEQHVEELGN